MTTETQAHHFPEPWEVIITENSIETTGCAEIKTTYRRTRNVSHAERNANMAAMEAEAVANARRIVAAVNACAGIPTEALEAGVVAEMLAVLESLTDPEGHIWHGGNDECTGECREVRAAIAQAKGRAS